MKLSFFNIITNYPIIKYICISLFTAGLETAIGFILVNKKGFPIVEANTISVLLGTTLHYLLISKKVFQKKISLWTIVIYTGTFLMGIVLQNVVIYYSYEHLLANLTSYFRYAGSKFLSVIIPFGLIYSVRKKLYLMWD